MLCGALVHSNDSINVCSMNELNIPGCLTDKTTNPSKNVWAEWAL